MWAPLGIGFISAEADDGGYTYEEASIHYGSRRPFSFYYPYNYQYYYPHPQYHSSSNSCYWTYTNGTYVYVCD